MFRRKKKDMIEPEVLCAPCLRDQHRQVAPLGNYVYGNDFPEESTTCTRCGNPVPSRELYLEEIRCIRLGRSIREAEATMTDFASIIDTDPESVIKQIAAEVKDQEALKNNVILLRSNQISCSSKIDELNPEHISYIY